MINVGIVGCGSIVRHRHAPEYYENSNANIIGFYDISEERTNELALKYDAKVFSSYSEMLLDDDIDAISVCSSNETHAKYTIEALRFGKHVLCEKPMAVTIKEAEDMILEAQKADKILTLGHNQRFVPAHIKAKEILKEGKLGKVLCFQTNFKHKGPELWGATKGKDTWFFKKSIAAIGVMADLGIHKIDLIQWLLDDNITDISASLATIDKVDMENKLIEVEDNAFCNFKTEKGKIGSLHVSWTNYGNEDNSTTFYCKKGTMKIFVNPDDDIEINYNNGEKETYSFGGIQTNDCQTNSGIIDAFINSIISNNQPAITGEEGLKSLRVALACLESSLLGKSISLY